MSRLFLALCVVVGLAAPIPSIAQDLPAERLFSIEVGNRWEYFYSLTRTRNGETTTEATGYAIVEALRDTLVADEPWVIYSMQLLDADGNETSAGFHRGRVLEPDTWAIEHVPGAGVNDGYLGAYRTDGVVLGAQSSGGEVTVGGVTYPVGRTAFVREGSGCGPGTTCSVERSHAAGIGLYLAQSFRFRPNVIDETSTYLLGYAEVGGVVFGAPVLSSTPPGPAPVSARAVLAVPNPASSAVSFALTGAWTGAIDVSVYDTLGRLLHREAFAPTRAPRLRVADLPVGVYVVRVTDGTGEQASARFSRR